MRVDGAAVMITGANRGLGRALVDAFLAAGAARIHATMREPQDIFGDPRVETEKLDVTDDASVAALAARIAALDLLVNNAAALSKLSVLGPWDLGPARLEMETNYFGVLRMCRAFAPRFRAGPGGGIVNILSIGALASVPSSGSYCASKAAAWSLTQSLAAELAPAGVEVAAVCAGPIATAMARPESAAGRCPPEVMAAEIVAAIGRGEARIFPDPRSRAAAETYRADPWALQAALAASAAKRMAEESAT